MGKGDKKTKRGKIIMGSYGVSRKRKSSSTAAPKKASAKKTEKAAPKKAAPAKAKKKE
jgi:30S ribosomal protein S31